MSIAIIIISEQRIILASRVPIYVFAIISLLVFLFLAIRSRATGKSRQITRDCRSSSVTSNATTLVDPDEDVAKHTCTEGKKRHRVSFSTNIPFNRVGTSVKMAFSRSKALDFKPKLPRRLSLPARRFSTSVITTLHHLTPHHQHNDKVDSSVTERKTDTEMKVVASVDASVPTIVEGVAQPQIQLEMTEDVKGSNHPMMTCTLAPPSPKKTTKFRRITRKASIIMGITRRS